METGRDLLFVHALEQLVEALDEEAGLTANGRRLAQVALAELLATQIHVRLETERHAETSAAIGEPVFVVGLPGAGAAMARDLLAGHPFVHVPRLRELLGPAEPWDLLRREPAIGRSGAFVDDLLGDGTTSSGEGQDLLASTFQSMVFPLWYRVPSYATWLARQDREPVYRYHRTQLQIVRRRTPDRLLVSGSPSYVWDLDVLVRAYPRARFVLCHREPVDAVTALCATSTAMRHASGSRADPRLISAFWVPQVERALEAVERGVGRLPDGQVLDLRYDELVADPLRAAGRLCDFAGLPMTESARDAIRRRVTVGTAWRGRPESSPEDFGLDRSPLAERFAAYWRTYGR